ncbi:MAG: nucleoside triphosphate pyrophosphohydrolase family protein [Patescibacteria group bacterium]
MTFQEYQEKSKLTAMYPAFGAGYVYPALGLASEAGEVAGKIKKIIRDFNGVVDAERKEQLRAELGDVLWYTAQLALQLDLSLDDIAEANIAKLLSRKDRGVIQGSGDAR